MTSEELREKVAQAMIDAWDDTYGAAIAVVLAEVERQFNEMNRQGNPADGPPMMFVYEAVDLVRAMREGDK